MVQGLISKRFTRGTVKFLCQDKHGEDGISYFRPWMMLNAALKILAKILADLLQTAIPSLIGTEQCYIVKGRTI